MMEDDEQKSQLRRQAFSFGPELAELITRLVVNECRYKIKNGAHPFL